MKKVFFFLIFALSLTGCKTNDFFGRDTLCDEFGSVFSFLFSGNIFPGRMERIGCLEKETRSNPLFAEYFDDCDFEQRMGVTTDCMSLDNLMGEVGELDEQDLEKQISDWLENNDVDCAELFFRNEK